MARVAAGTAAARGRRPQDQMEIDAIDSMLGEDDPYASVPRNAGAFRDPKPGSDAPGITDPSIFSRPPSSTPGPKGPTSSPQPIGDPTRGPSNIVGYRTMDEAVRGGMRPYSKTEQLLVDRGYGTPNRDDPNAGWSKDLNVEYAAPPANGDEPPVIGPTSPGGMPQGGNWGSNYEWTPSEGGPRVSDIQTGAFGGDGFNTAGWGSGQRGSESFKNTFGMLASNIDPRQPGATRAVMALPQFKQFFPNARLIEHPKGDQIDFGDGRPVDVLVNAVEGGSGDAWAFQTQDDPDAIAAAGAFGAAGPPVPPIDPDESTLADIMASINALASGDEDPLVKREIERLLGEASPALIKQIAPTLAGKNIRGSSRRSPGAVPTGRSGGVR